MTGSISISSIIYPYPLRRDSRLGQARMALSSDAMLGWDGN
jgi:hypothetical protein